MNALDWQEFTTRLALTMLHFLWQGVLVWIIAAIVLRWLKNVSANARYWAVCTTLLCLPPLAIATFAFVEVPTRLASNPSIALALPRPINTDNELTVPALTDESTNVQIENPTQSEPFAQSTAHSSTSVFPAEPAPVLSGGWLKLQSYFPVLTLLYFAGVAIMLIRLFLSVCRGSRLRLKSTVVTDKTLLKTIERLAGQMKLKVAPTVHFCEQVAVPAVVGILKPTILLPASLLTQLTTDELSAILSHELAHIRRFDLPIQLIQKVIESMLFFHPVVWWLSRRVNDERENCCDDLAAASGVGNVGYAAALIRIAEICSSAKNSNQSPQQLAALSATGSRPSQISQRIERQLLGHSHSHVSFKLVPLIAVALILAAVLAAAIAMLQWTSPDDSTDSLSVVAAESSPVVALDDVYLKNTPPHAVQVNLAHGGAVRLHALMNPAAPKDGWWSPGGERIEGHADWNRRSKHFSGEGLVAILEAVHPNSQPSKAKVGPDGEEWGVPLNFWAPVKIEDGIAPKIVAGFGARQWQSLGNVSKGDSLGDGDFLVKFIEDSPIGNGSVIRCDVQLNCKIEFALIAVGKDGTRSKIGPTYNPSSNAKESSGTWVLRGIASSIPHGSLSHVEVLTRPKCWAEFEGFALKSGDPNANPVGKATDVSEKPNVGTVSGQIKVTAPPKLPARKIPPNYDPTSDYYPPLELRAKIEIIQDPLVEVEDTFFTIGADGGLANAFVYLKSAPAGTTRKLPPVEAAVLSLTDFHTIQPRSLLVQAGQNLVFRNSHDHAATFRFEATRSSAEENHLVKSGDEIKLTAPLKSTFFPLPVKSNLVQGTPAYILTLHHSFAAVTDANGRFEIKGLPDGEHAFSVWHERTGFLPQIKAVVKDGKAIEVSHSIPGSRFVKD